MVACSETTNKMEQGCDDHIRYGMNRMFDFLWRGKSPYQSDESILSTTRTLPPMAFGAKQKDKQQIRRVGRHKRPKNRLKALQAGPPVKDASLSCLASQDSGFMRRACLFRVDHSP